MTDQPETATANNAPQNPDDASNPAVARCCAEFVGAYKAARAGGKDDYDARKAATSAYRAAMPPLSGSDNIRDFIACVAHGLLIETISGNEATRLLYAAQVATGAHKNQPSRKKPAA